MKIELDKEYQTRDGREVRIYAVDGRGTYPVHGAIMTSDGWDSVEWGFHGDYIDAGTMRADDLIEKPEVIEGWINIYRTSFGENVGSLHESKESALLAGTESKKLGCIPIKFIKGTGL